MGNSCRSKFEFIKPEKKKKVAKQCEIQFAHSQHHKPHFYQISQNLNDLLIQPLQTSMCHNFVMPAMKMKFNRDKNDVLKASR